MWVSPPELILIQGILIHGMCIFRVRAATAASQANAELDEKYK